MASNQSLTSFIDDEDAPLLKTVSLHVALDTEPLDAALSCPRDATQNSWDESQPASRLQHMKNLNNETVVMELTVRYWQSLFSQR